MAIRRFGIHSAFASALLAFPITALSAGDPALGAMLYVNPNGAPLGCANAACHGPNPAANMNGITRGADQPSLILNAINTRPEMMFLRTFINAVQAEHIAAYIANPNGLPTGTIALSNNALGFGNQSLSTTSASQTVTVSNSGSNTVTLTAIALGGTNPTEFARSGTCANGMALAAGSTCTIAATFTPAQLGSRNASVAIVHSGANSPLQIALSGNGVAAPGPVMSLSASSLTFAGQGTNTTSAVQIQSLVDKAETRTFLGVVVDSSGTPIRNASVEVLPELAEARTDSAGRFAIRGMPARRHLVRVRRVGYPPLFLSIDLTDNLSKSARIVMRQFAGQNLGLVVVRANRPIGRMAGFMQRAEKRTGWGRIFTAEDIAARNPLLTSDLFRAVAGTERDTTERSRNS